MPNHFHLEIRQNADIPISKLIAKVCTSYGKYFNKKYEKVGGLFQDAFKAVHIESDSQLLWLSAYIHNNPKVAGLIENLKDYQWSSYPDYAGLRQGTLCDKNFILKQFANVDAYKKFVDDAFEKIKERKDLEHLFLD
jgi:putative transposase